MKRLLVTFVALIGIAIVYFQATGEIKCDHIMFGWKESRDVLAAIDFIRRTRPTHRVAIIGCSLDGAAALLATPPLRVARRRPIPDPSLVESIAVATWCFGFAIASGRSHWRRRVSSFRHERRKRYKHQTGRHADVI